MHLPINSLAEFVYIKFRNPRLVSLVIRRNTNNKDMGFLPVDSEAVNCLSTVCNCIGSIAGRKLALLVPIIMVRSGSQRIDLPLKIIVGRKMQSSKALSCFYATMIKFLSMTKA